MSPSEIKSVIKWIYIFNAFLSFSPLQKDYRQIFLHRTTKLQEHATNDLLDPIFSAVAIGRFKIRQGLLWGWSKVVDTYHGFPGRCQAPASPSGFRVGTWTPFELGTVSLVPVYVSSICYQLQLFPVLMPILFERFSGACFTLIFSVLVGTVHPLCGFTSSELPVCVSAEMGGKVSNLLLQELCSPGFLSSHLFPKAAW